MPILPIGKDCCGCSACESACNYDALYLRLDDEGFHRPFINENCVECKCCEVACPNLPFLSGTEYDKVKNKSKFKANTSINEVYAIKAKDKELVANSSSGGVFSLLAEQVLASGGVVFGAAFDENFDVKHIKVTDKNELYRLRTSKYVESYLGRTFEEVLKELKTGKKVLFSGVQCQVHGLNSFLKKPYENLLSVEVICNSIPSVKIWRIYKGYLEQKIGKLTSFNFRDISKSDWGNQCVVCCSNDRKIFDLYGKNPFIKGFLQHKITRESCAQCKAKNGASGADITLGDFWGIKNIHPEFFDKKGVSVVIARSQKAISAINEIMPFVEIIKSNYDKAVAHNRSFIRSHPSSLQRAECIAKIIENASVNITEIKNEKELENEKKLAYIRGGKTLKEITGSLDIGILTFSTTPQNYGQVLQMYALQKYLKTTYKDLSIKNYEASDILGHPRKIVYSNENEQGISKSEKIIRKNYNIRKKAFDDFRAKYISFERSNFGANAVIVGSDQVWNDWGGFSTSAGRRKSLGVYALDFVKSKNILAKKISYAASFGRHEFSDELNKFFKEKLADFDAISIREQANAKDLEKWGLKGEVVPDPTMLLSKKEWSAFADEYDSKGKIFAYLFASDETKFNELFDNLGLPVVKVYAHGSKNLAFGANSNQLSPKEWIGAIKNAKFMITNSYHGAVFATILNTPFFMLRKPAGSKVMDDSRAETLVKIAGLEEFLVSDISEFDIEKFKKINWKDVNTRLENYRQIGVEFLESALKDFASQEAINGNCEVKTSVFERNIERLMGNTAGKEATLKKIFESKIKELEINNEQYQKELKVKNEQYRNEQIKLKMQNHLSYKLGKVIIANSKSFWGYVTMPYLLGFVAWLHHSKIYDEKTMQNLNFKSLTIQEQDEIKKIKNYLSYKLGFALIKGAKTWYKGGLIKFIFEAIKLKNEHKKKF